MKRIIGALTACALAFFLVACGDGIREESSTPSAATSDITAGEAPSDPVDEETEGEGAMVPITISVGDEAFSAMLADTEAARQLAAQLPVTYDMSELNGNEKYVYTGMSFSTDGASIPSTISAGDVMLFGSDCVVVFYETHPNDGYSYTPLATVDDPTGLAEALGPGSATVTISAQ